MIEDSLCSFEVAKLLDEKRFSERCDYFYQIATQKLYRPNIELKEYNINGILYRCPNYAQVFDWLRNNHKIHIVIDCYRSVHYQKLVWSYDIRFLDDEEKVDQYERSDSPREAIEAAIKYVLKNEIEIW